MSDQSRDSDECMDIYCDLCKEQRAANVLAEGFCLDCTEYLCSTCLTYHQRYMRTHKHQDENDMPKDICTDTCNVHTDKFIKFYCEDCNDFICMKCKNKHNNCTKCSFLPLLVKNIENSEDFKDFENRLVHFKTALDETKVSFDQMHECIESYKKEASNAIKTQKQEFIEDYDNATKKFERTIEQIYNDDKAKHNFITKQMDSLADEFNKLMNDISNQKNCEQRCKLFMKLKMNVSLIDHLNGKIANARKESLVTMYKYKPEVSILKGLSVGEMEINGEVITDDCGRVSLQQKLYKSREAEQKSREAEQKARKAEQKSREAEHKSIIAEQKLTEAEQKSRAAEHKSEESEQKSRDAEKKSREAEKKSRDAEQKLTEAKLKLRDAEQKKRDAEQKSKDAEQKSRDAVAQSRAADKQVEESILKLKHFEIYAGRVNKKKKQKLQEDEEKYGMREIIQKSIANERKLIEAEQKYITAERKSKEIVQKLKETEQKLLHTVTEQTLYSRVIDQKLKDTEQTLRTTEITLRITEQTLRTTKQTLREAEQKSRKAEQKLREAEQKLTKAERTRQVSHSIILVGIISFVIYFFYIVLPSLTNKIILEILQ